MILPKLRRRVEGLERAPQHHHRVGIEVLRPRLGLLDDGRLARGGVGILRRQLRLDAVELQGRDAHLGQDRRHAALVVIPAAVPARVLGQLLDELLRRRGPARALRRRHDRHDAAHEVRVGHRPLERLIAAIGGADDGDEMLDAQMVEQRLLRPHDVADGVAREIGAVGLAGLRVDRCRVGRAVGRAQHVGGHHEQPAGIDSLAWPDQLVPAADIAGLVAFACTGRAVGARGVMTAGVAVRVEHGVAAIRRERSVGLVGQRQLGEHDAALELEVARGEELALGSIERLRIGGNGERHGCRQERGCERSHRAFLHVDRIGSPALVRDNGRGHSGALPWPRQRLVMFR